MTLNANMVTCPLPSMAFFKLNKIAELDIHLFLTDGKDCINSGKHRLEKAEFLCDPDLTLQFPLFIQQLASSYMLYHYLS